MYKEYYLYEKHKYFLINKKIGGFNKDNINEQNYAFEFNNFLVYCNNYKKNTIEFIKNQININDVKNFIKYIKINNKNLKKKIYSNKNENETLVTINSDFTKFSNSLKKNIYGGVYNHPLFNYKFYIILIALFAMIYDMNKTNNLFIEFIKEDIHKINESLQIIFSDDNTLLHRKTFMSNIHDLFYNGMRMLYQLTKNIVLLIVCIKFIEKDIIIHWVTNNDNLENVHDDDDDDDDEDDDNDDEGKTDGEMSTDDDNNDDL